MKKPIMVLVILFVFAGFVSAHPPQEVTIDYNHDTKVLDIRVDHSTPNVNEHYINNLKIYLNGEKIIEQDAKAQLTSDSQITKYQIPTAEVGSKLKVEAICNKYGNLNKTITIEKPEPKE